MIGAVRRWFKFPLSIPWMSCLSRPVLMAGESMPGSSAPRTYSLDAQAGIKKTTLVRNAAKRAGTPSEVRDMVAGEHTMPIPRQDRRFLECRLGSAFGACGRAAPSAHDI